MSRGRSLGLGMMLLALLVAGCAAPQFTYVTNSNTRDGNGSGPPGGS